MGTSKTHDVFVSELLIKHPNLVALTQYCSAHKKIVCECRLDGYRWEVAPHSLLRGSGCPRCSKKERLNTRTFISKLQALNPNIVVLGEYVNTDTPILCQCRIDKYEWRPTPHHLFDGVGCPMCAGVACKTTEQFRREMESYLPHITVLGEYRNNKEPVLCECVRCGHTWSASPNALLCGHSNCAVCNCSSGELKIMQYLDKHNIQYFAQYRFDDCRDVLPLPFDFYLPSQNTVIEYDGIQHFLPVDFGGRSSEASRVAFETGQYHDEMKTRYCSENNLTLVRIPYTEFDHIDTILDKHLL